MSTNEPSFAIDRTGVALIFTFALVLTPTMMLAAVWLVTDGFALERASVASLVAAGLSVLLALYMIRVTARELAGAIGVRIDELGISKGRFELRWDEVETLEAPSFGLLEITGKGQRLCLRTYLYDDRTNLLEFIARRTGKQVPELGHSF